MKIHLLSEETYEKISAGEVIERPASALRELIDNAIDAEASEIKLFVINGGKKLIQVMDNGCGMDSKDLDICYKKHTTSKIKEFDDIYNIMSLGFRGEALNSIAVISRMIIESKRRKDVIGNSILIKAGKITKRKQMAKNQGTNIRVYDLFYNIPVRQKTLKSEATEFRAIKDTFIRKSLSFNKIDFSLTHNEKLIYKSNKSDSKIERINLFFGDSFTDNMIYIEEEFEGFNVSGYISKPNHFKKSKKFQYTYINNRPIFSPMLSSVIAKGYEGISPIGEHPFVFLFLEIPPELIDVNIHPAKKEVKILNESQMYHYMYHLIKDRIAKSPSLPSIKFSDDKRESQDYTKQLKRNTKEYLKEHYEKENKENEEKDKQETSFIDNKPFNKAFLKENSIPNYNVREIRNISDILNDKNKDIKETTKIEDSETKDSKEVKEVKEVKVPYRIIGSLFNTYIVMEDGEEFIILDQHAAHERLEYEKIKKRIQNNNIDQQRLLKPFTIEIPPYEIDKIQDKEDDLKRLGFEIELFSNNSYIILSIPYFMKVERAKDAIETLIDYVLNDKELPNLLEYIEEMLKMNACKTAIKAGHIVLKEETCKLINELMLYENPFACPHGRPTALCLNKKEIERLFLRKK